MPTAELKLAMIPPLLSSPPGLQSHGKAKSAGRHMPALQAGPAMKWVLRPNQSPDQDQNAPAEISAGEQPDGLDALQHEIHQDALAAEFGLPPGTEIVRSERTGEPLISMSAAIQWMQQLGHPNALPRPSASARYIPPDPDTIATRAVDRWIGGGHSGRIIRERAPKRETRDTDKRTSKYRGVSWNSAGSKWVAVLWDRGLKRARHIGTFDSELDAARAYDQAARQLIGPSARLNFRDQRAPDGSSDEGPGGSAIASELSLGEGVGRARPSRTQSSGSRLRSAPATPFSALLHAVARDGSVPAHQNEPARHGSFPGAGKRRLEVADLEPAPQQKRSRSLLLPEMIHDSQQLSYRPVSAGRQLVSPFAPRGAQKLDGERCASREQEPSEAIHKAAPMASRLSSAHGPTRPQMRDDGSDEDFLPFESQRKSGPRSGSHARKLPLSSGSAPLLEGVTSTAPTSGTSAFKGVSLNRGSNRWEARIRIRGRTGARNVYLGSFVDEVAAARAFDSAVLSLHGASHPMNFSPDEYTEADMLSIRPKIDKIIQQHAVTQAASDIYKPPDNAQDLSSGSGDGDDSAPWWPGPGKRSSKFKGVSWSESSMKWRAQYWNGSKVQYIGYFDTEEDAAVAYDREIVQQRGPSAQTNFPPARLGNDEKKGSMPQVSKQPGAEARDLDLVSPGKAALERSSSAPARPPRPPQKSNSQTNSSIFRGVSWSDRSGKWRAQLWHDNKVHHLGFFESEQQAAQAHDHASLQLHGDQAQLNFPQPDDSTFHPAAGQDRAVRSQAGSKDPVPFQRTNRTIVTPAVQ
ncbi:hypothetical protein WJX84_001531 [Apatococcus fuscideae]|uniref:AP2/ERF domain-containing protein n=1 Tax=Apatococcus fuscideae TaxID=2026836 RepID=A0AAW1TJE3_9CHLO